MPIIRDPNNPEYKGQTYTPAPPVAGYVYLVHPIGHNVYKIGCTTDLARRMKKMQSGHDYKLEYIAAIYYENYIYAEFKWHRKYERYHLSSEWYALPDSEVEHFKGLAE